MAIFTRSPKGGQVRECPVCGNEVTGVSYKKYCSDECQIKERRRRCAAKQKRLRAQRRADSYVEYDPEGDFTNFTFPKLDTEYMIQNKSFAPNTILHINSQKYKINDECKLEPIN